MLRRLAPEGSADHVVGDLEEAHRNRVERRGRLLAGVLTGIEALDIGFALVVERMRRGSGGSGTVDSEVVSTRRMRLLPRMSWLDLKLGFRMLVKYPGLTAVGGLAMAFAIAVGAAAFEFVTQTIHPALPLDRGDRIVGIRLWHTASSSAEEQALFDFVMWRESLESVEELGAFRTLARNLIAGEGRGEPVVVAEMTASGFRVAGIRPLMGRPLLDADERASSPPVVVIGHDIWLARFGGDPDVVGRTVRLGSVVTTVVGVMPEGFGFPVAHSVWSPLRSNAAGYGPREGPEVVIFGRLAPGVGLKAAQVELTALGANAAAAFPDTHEHLVPQVMPYAQLFWELPAGVMYAINLFFVMLLALVCANVALLMFARAATRETEIVVRNALGASRGRITMQLFAEALVLGTFAAAAGLASASYALGWWLRVAEADGGTALPFWFSDRLAPGAVLYAGMLTVLGALIASVVPALEVTRGLGVRLRRAAAGAGGFRFGGVWTAVIVTQVAVTVAFPAAAFFLRRSVVQIRSLDVGFAAEEYLSARLELDREDGVDGSSEATASAHSDRFRATVQALERRLSSETAVVGVTFTDRLPRTHHPARRIEVDATEPALDSSTDHRAGAASIDVGYFDVLGPPILFGRGFRPADAGSEVVIVNRSFVRRALAGRNPIGRHVRYLIRDTDEPGSAGEPASPWYEIVGVVGDLGIVTGDGEPGQDAGLYHPVAAGAVHPMHVAVHVRGDPESFAPTLRSIAIGVEPTLRLHDVLPLDRVGASMWLESDFLFRLVTIVSAVALLLSLTAVYSVLSFTVSRRTREIGIRIALGAEKRRILFAVFRRPLVQVGIGVLAGGGLVAALSTAVLAGLTITEAALVVAYAALMLTVCMLACIVPAWRALRVQPTEALRQD